MAYNASFEQSFLAPEFEQNYLNIDFIDGLPFMGLLFPKRGSLKLENFIKDWKIAEYEEHRGLQDSIDLLKVILVAVAMQQKYSSHYQALLTIFEKNNFTDYWFYQFFKLEKNDLYYLAEQLEFDLEQTVNYAIDFEYGVGEDTSSSFQRDYSLDFSGENIKEILRDEEGIKEKLDFYSYREAQEELALRTGQSFKNNVHAMIQAPTGTGKTLGHLLSSSLFSYNEVEQVLVATGTKTLQQQAMTKDIPQLRKLLGLDHGELRIKRLIGSGNHFCELNFRETLAEEDLLSSKHFDDKFIKVFFEYLFYLNANNETENSIHRDDLAYVLKRVITGFQDTESKLAVDFRACTGHKCPFANDCSYIRGLREAKDAHIIVGNHALMFSWPRSFPRPKYIVVDEAHRLEDEATKTFSIELSFQDLEGLNKSLYHQQGLGSLYYLLAQYEQEAGDSTAQIEEIRSQSQSTYQVLGDHLEPLKGLIELFFHRLPKFTSKFWNEVPFPEKSKCNDPSLISVYNHLESIFFVINNFMEKIEPYVSRFDANMLEGDMQMTAFTRMETFVSQLDDIHLALQSIIEHKDGFTHSLNYHEEYGSLFKSAPIDTGKMLHQQLLETSSSVVMVSATLANSDGTTGVRGMEWASGYAYLQPEKRFKSGFFLPSPYDYEQNTKVYLCDDMNHFSHQDFVPDVIDKISPLIEKLGGRTLLLFSSRVRFETAREVLLEKFSEEIPLFCQGMGANIIDEFKASEKGILLGLESFGEGIDIPGSNLEFIFIDKIPDLRMDLVINDRRRFYETHFGNEFQDYYLSHRARSLHQKLGRLMRRESDRGGIIVCDSRVKKWKKRTIDQFHDLMRPYDIKRSTIDEACLEISDFLIDEPANPTLESLNI
jgi:ATP-dependent DNA helicase DinG